MTAPARVLTCRSPADLAALVPQLVGFAPTESLVVISLRGPRRRLGLTVRVDLCDLPMLLDQIVGALDRDGAAGAVLVVHSADPTDDRHPWADLVDEVTGALDGRGIEVTEALLVRDGAWWSYGCAQSCCPPRGTPLDPGSPLLRAVASEHAYDGRAVLASREELVASLQPGPPLGESLARRLQAQAREDLEERLVVGAAPAVRTELSRWRTALDAWEQRPGALLPADCAALAVGLHLVEVRDVVASWGLSRGDPLLGLLGQLAGAVVAPDDAPLCAVLGWVSYARGNGALALIAVQRALTTDPTYSLARLLLAAIDGLLPPEQVRDTLRPGGSTS